MAVAPLAKALVRRQYQTALRNVGKEFGLPPEQPEARMAAVGRVPVMRCRSGEDVRPSRTPASARVHHILSLYGGLYGGRYGRLECFSCPCPSASHSLIIRRVAWRAV